MKLTKDNAQLYNCVAQVGPDNARLEKVDTVAEANAIIFDCPVPGHGHKILVYFAPHGSAGPVPPDWRPLPRWQVSGMDVTNITIQPSINLDVKTEVCGHPDCNAEANPCPRHPGAGRKTLPPGCVWHGSVTNGVASP